MVRKVCLFFTVVLFLFADEKMFNFDKMKEGIPPKSWHCKSTWTIEEKDSLTSGKKVLSMIDNKKTILGFGGGFNYCYIKKVNFFNGVISVNLKANSGRSDQGGGLMWRVQDGNNYYVVRYNPLEDNFTFYKVINGNRIELKNVDIYLKKGWHNIKIVQNGSKFKGYLDGKELLTYEDNSIREPGGVGVWTKSDAKTSFDDLIIDTWKK